MCFIMMYLNTLRLLCEMCLLGNCPVCNCLYILFTVIFFYQIQNFFLNICFHFKPLYMPSHDYETLNFASFSHSIKEGLDF